MSARKLKGEYIYEYHYDTDDNEWSRESTEQRRKKRERDERKRKRIEDEAKKQRDLHGGDGVISAYSVQLQQIIGSVNTPELMRITLSEVGKKVRKHLLLEWAEKLVREITDLPESVSLKPPLGLYDLLPLEIFNGWIQGGKFPKFTEDRYKVKVVDLLNMEDYREVLWTQNEYPTMHLKLDRERFLKKKWEAYITKKMIKARNRGMVIKASAFKKLNKYRFESDGFLEADAWKEYKKTWCLLMGLKPVDNLWTFFSRVKATSLNVAPTTIVDISKTSNEEDADNANDEVADDGGGPYPNEEDDMPIPDYFGEDSDAGWVVAGGGSDEMEPVEADEMEPVEADEMEPVEADEMEPVEANGMEVESDEEND